MIHREAYFARFIGYKTYLFWDILVEEAKKHNLTPVLVSLDEKIDDGFQNIDIDDNRLNVFQKNGLIERVKIG